VIRQYRLSLALLLAFVPIFASAHEGDPIALDVKPKICTLAADDDLCETTVRAQWRASREESLCLVIVGRPEIKRCWEHYSEGSYRVELAFDQDLVVQLRDPQLENVLASAAITIIREALQLRRKRRQPWNILY
jgi:hypothetical protein